MTDHVQPVDIVVVEESIVHEDTQTGHVAVGPFKRVQLDRFYILRWR
jgi:hypothetical protein